MTDKSTDIVNRAIREILSNAADHIIDAMDMIDVLEEQRPKDAPGENLGQAIADALLAAYQPGSGLVGYNVGKPLLSDKQVAILRDEVTKAQNQQEMMAVLVEHAPTVTGIVLKVLLA